MRRHRVLLLLTMITMTAGLTLTACRADPIQPEQRICASDHDCQTIALECACQCGFKQDAVNAKFAQEFTYLASCSEAQIQRCAESGACAKIKEPLAVCQQGQCAVVWREIRR